MSEFGFHLFLESQKSNIKSKNDILVIFMHWMFVKNKFRNIGIGDNKIPSDDDKPSELLPPGWNGDQDSFKLRYILDNNIYIFHGLKTDENLLVNLLNGKTLETASLVIETEKIVKSLSGSSVEEFITDFDNLISRVDKEIIDPMSKVKPPKAAVSLEEEPRSSRRFTPYADPNPSRDFRIIDPLRDIGRGDLDPFGQGGGMLFDPRRPGLMNPHPRLGIPPGARFDPPNPFPGRMDPDNDHYRPPGPPPDGYDDMFM